MFLSINTDMNEVLKYLGMSFYVQLITKHVVVYQLKKLRVDLLGLV